MSCLSDENLAALVDGSVDADRLAAWKAHISTCDTCATRFARRQVGSPEPEPAPDSTTDPDATITVKPPGKPNLDAKAEHTPADAIPGYKILKELHRGGQGLVYQVGKRVQLKVPSRWNALMSTLQTQALENTSFN